MDRVELEVILDIPQIHHLLYHSKEFEMVLIEYICSVLLYDDEFDAQENDRTKNAIRLNRFSELTEAIVYNQVYEDDDANGMSEECAKLATEIERCNDIIFPISGIIDEIFDTQYGRNIILYVQENDYILENIIAYSANSIMLIFTS